MGFPCTCNATLQLRSASPVDPTVFASPTHRENKIQIVAMHRVPLIIRQGFRLEEWHGKKAI